MAYVRHAADMDTAMLKKRVKWCLIILVRMTFPTPAAIKARIISTGPPPNRKVNAQQARAEARPSFAGE